MGHDGDPGGHDEPAHDVQPNNDCDAEENDGDHVEPGDLELVDQC